MRLAAVRNSDNLDTESFRTLGDTNIWVWIVSLL